MDITNTAITGSETDVGKDTPYSILVEFYRAFNNQDLALMQDNWLQGMEPSMSNPLGGIKRGWDEIRQVYEKIFFGQARVYVEFYDYSIYTADEMFTAVGRERGKLSISSKTIELAIRTSRTYCVTNGRWKQLHHHGSMDDAALLARYQTTLLPH